jgi:hypothetical protein
MRTLKLFLIVVVACAQQSTAGIQQLTPDPVHGEISGKILRETRHFSIYAEKGFMPVDLDWLEAEAETIYAYVAERIGVRTDERFAIAFRKPDTSACPIRGLAQWATPVAQVIVFADERTSRAQVLGVLAHEVGHLMHGRALKAGTRFGHLDEGLATWAAGKYWEAWQKASFTEMMNAFRRSGRYVPLKDYFREEAPAQFPSKDSSCLAERDLRYTSWGAFLGFLIDAHGMDKLRQLLGPVEEIKGPEPGRLVTIPRGGDGFDIDVLTRGVFRTETVWIPPPVPDFPGVYGRTLDELEKAWWEQITKTR